MKTGYSPRGYWAVAILAQKQGWYIYILRIYRIIFRVKGQICPLSLTNRTDLSFFSELWDRFVL